ncbi:hypothetical protein PF008_g18238 [Phytophthora fragariae]|uniref:Uncharacterized protein n=1 Tax=Phytophthora fragariae TaxID=53985 RepID=A0A6G0R720_9STRA|nr:hypothetical protein PF008_g18238 [Phytophthora fragariae]
MHRFSRCSLVCPCACATPSCTPRHSQAQSSFLFSSLHQPSNPMRPKMARASQTPRRGGRAPGP